MSLTSLDVNLLQFQCLSTMTIIDCIIDRPIEVFSLLLKKNKKPMLNFSLFEPSFSPLADGDKVKSRLHGLFVHLFVGYNAKPAAKALLWVLFRHSTLYISFIVRTRSSTHNRLDDGTEKTLSPPLSKMRG